MASFNFNSFVRDVITGSIDLNTDSFKMLLVSVLPDEADKDAWAKRSDVTDEVTGTGYTAGGVAVALTVAAIDTANNDVEVTCSAGGWPSSTISAVGAVIYKSRGGAASADELVSVIDFGGTVTSTNGTFTATPTGSIKFQN